MSKYVPKSPSEAQITEKKSRFIAYIARVQDPEEAKKTITERRKLFKNANHHPYALLLGELKKYSDDGEPAGTSGKPILTRMERAELFETLIIVSRIFGGIKLGAAGLTRAYVKAASSAIKSARLQKLVKVVDFELACSYKHLEEFKCLTDSVRVYFMKETFAENVLISFSVPESDEIIFTELLKRSKRTLPAPLKKGERFVLIDFLPEKTG
ncbi:YigZ family protein [candidate division WOR-3 bacterium]|nr:YigZ family protein [candidate division WOR-3 bacterium]